MQKALIDQVRRDNKESLRVLKKFGIQVTQTEAAFVNDMEDASHVVWQQLATTLYPPELLARIQKLLAEFRAGQGSSTK
jgi:hypothetical protein